MSKHSHKYRLKLLRKAGCRFGYKLRLNCDIEAFGSEPFLIDIGDDCLIAEGVKFITHDGAVKVLNSLHKFDKDMSKMGSIVLGNNCYIGMAAYIMPNVKNGNNVIIGARAVVTKDIPDNSVAVGIPDRVICSVDDYYKK